MDWEQGSTLIREVEKKLNLVQTADFMVFSLDFQDHDVVPEFSRSGNFFQQIDKQSHMLLKDDVPSLTLHSPNLNLLPVPHARWHMFQLL